MDKKPELEDNGAALLAAWQKDPAAIKFKFPVATEVQKGDAVYLSSETGQYEKVTETSDFHGLFDGYDVVILVTINERVLPLRHSPIDGHIEPGVWKMGEE